MSENKDISLVKINRPSRVVKYHWEKFIKCLLESGVDPDENEKYTLILWNGYMLGYEKGLDEEGCGTEFFNQTYKCADCGAEIDEEKDERATTFWDNSVPQKPWHVCDHCLELRKEKHRLNEEIRKKNNAKEKLS